MKKLVFLAGLLFSLSAHAATSQLKLDLLFAKRGDVSAQFSVATAYEFGTDVEKDLKQAFEWYLKAANQSHAPSQFKVAHFYENGLGVAKNIDTAMSWYNKAKANGSDQASKRLNKTAYEQNEKAAKEQRAELQAKLEKEENERQTQKAAQEKLAKERAEIKKQAVVKPANKPTPKEVVKKKAAPVQIPDIMNVVLTNKWKNKNGAADFLPSASTTCLESGEKELTCFSSEKSRKVNAANVTYTAKSTIVGFQSNGSFKVIYHYNGINIEGVKSTGADIYGLTLKEGWQEPAIAAKCKASDRNNITCYRGSNQIKFTR
ncbi:MAG: sel1 repeat family protein [Gammaproteobacteria bacterium]|nr:sel1 repeat family protein [Gammaproteobacteria bacterium]MCW8987924.1 sel1 repeat family protein [Gammaproteobacteria bacterium]MCW9029968.1 sel1 repeat family protein [Gammaproteobacteria bacterium]